ncbi:MAG: acetyl-CoA carboxylase carboxyl transferase subunit alpha, partial [Saprospiraceae bacterium]
RSWDFKETAAEALKLTPDHMLEFELIDEIVKEPLGGAHTDPEKMAKMLKTHIKSALSDLITMNPEDRITQRIEKYCKMGQYTIAE